MLCKDIEKFTILFTLLLASQSGLNLFTNNNLCDLMNNLYGVSVFHNAICVSELTVA